MSVLAHPLSISIIVSGSMAIALVTYASVVAAKRLVGRAPSGRHRFAPVASSTASVMLMTMGVMLVVHVAAFLPEFVPGAMCGTGVMRAAGHEATRAAAMLVLALAAMGAHGIVRDLGRGSSTGVLDVLSSRLLLAAAPLVLLAVWAVVRMLMGVETQQSVDCCSALRQSTGVGGLGFSSLPPWAWIAGLSSLSSLLVVGASVLLWRPATRWAAVLLAVSGPLWALGAWGALVEVLTTLIYGAPGHHCFWCLMRPARGLVGYPLLVAMLVVALQGPAALVASLAASGDPSIAQLAARRVRLCAVTVLLGLATYLVFTLA